MVLQILLRIVNKIFLNLLAEADSRAILRGKIENKSTLREYRI